MDILNNPNPLCRVLCPVESSCHKYWGQRLLLQAAQKPHYVLEPVFIGDERLGIQALSSMGKEWPSPSMPLVRPEVYKLPFLAAQARTMIIFGSLLARLVLIDFAYLCGITKIKVYFL